MRYVLVLLFFLSSCVSIRQIEYDQVAKVFSQNAVRKVFQQPDFTFDADSIYLTKEVSFDLIDKVFFNKAHIFTRSGESFLKTLSIKIRIEWLYLPEKRKVWLKFERVKYGTD